jgi:hypothetical protein
VKSEQNARVFSSIRICARIHCSDITFLGATDPTPEGFGSELEHARCEQATGGECTFQQNKTNRSPAGASSDGERATFDDTERSTEGFGRPPVDPAETWQISTQTLRLWEREEADGFYRRFYGVPYRGRSGGDGTPDPYPLFRTETP